MTIGELVAGVVIAVGVVLATLQLPKVWRAEACAQIPAWWLWGSAAYRGFVRAVPVGIVSGWPFLLILPWAFGLITSKSTASTIGLLTAASMTIIGFGLMVCVALFNWPRQLVPPKLRAQPGMLHEIMGAGEHH